MGVPQKRHRVFFIATRLDFKLDKIDMSFNYEPITYNQIKCGNHTIPNTKTATLALQSRVGDKDLRCVLKRKEGRDSYFSERILYKNEVCDTITSGGNEIWIENTGTHINSQEIVNAQTFPQDFNFCGAKVKYICGMSVPPIMIKRVVTRLIESGIFEAKEK
jgi:DNA (cytosine-5)-methyltransferase 1